MDNYKDDKFLFNTGKNTMAYNFLGSHIEQEGVRFNVWAPNAKSVSVVGNFNYWDRHWGEMSKDHETGIWTFFKEGISEYELYKYSVEDIHGNIVLKTDPFAFFNELKPNTASMTYNIDGYEWKDSEYIKLRESRDVYSSPVSIYEVNLASWKRNPDGNYKSYVQLADELVSYVKETGFNYVELMPVNEYPFDGSWGYQQTGYFAITSRFGTPKDFMYLVDRFHQAGIGVIVDWVPCHFAKDLHGLYRFDGTSQYESTDSFLAENTQWGTMNFDYGKNQVRSFLISSAIMLFDKYHIDGLRVDAVAYMIYRDMARSFSMDIINEDAVSFIKELNTQIFKAFPHALMMAEESSAYPKVTHPIHEGGLGFNFKWNMGYMNDTLKYFKQDPVYRKYYHNNLTFSLIYAFSENYVLPFSHDEVVHGKHSLVDKMPGDYYQKFSNLKLLYAYQYSHPGKKLVFMGGEFGQFIEWNEYGELDWFLMDYDSHSGVYRFVQDLNRIYTESPEFYEIERSWEGFEWIDHHRSNESLLSFKRFSKSGDEIACIFNFTPVERSEYWFETIEGTQYEEILSSDNIKYFGSGTLNGTIKSHEHEGKHYIRVKLAPLSAVFLKLTVKPEITEEKEDTNVKQK